VIFKPLYSQGNALGTHWIWTFLSRENLNLGLPARVPLLYQLSYPDYTESVRTGKKPLRA
jgi:hypothetical protein